MSLGCRECQRCCASTIINKEKDGNGAEETFMFEPKRDLEHRRLQIIRILIRKAGNTCWVGVVNLEVMFTLSPGKPVGRIIIE